MSLDIRATLRDGVERATSRPALPLTGAIALAQLGSTVALQSQQPKLAALLEERFEGTTIPADPGPLTVSLSQPVITVLALVAALGSAAAIVVAFRVFTASGEDGGVALDHRIVWATANVFLGQLVFGLMVALGIALFVLPALLAFVAFAFAPAFVAVEDRNVVRAFADSWAIGRGNRLELLAVFGVTLVAGLTVNAATTAAASLAFGESVPYELVRVTVSGAVAVFVVATIASAYDRLGELRAEEDELADIDDELLP